MTAPGLDLAAPLRSLPPFAAAWAYGSAVFAQPGLYDEGATPTSASRPPPMVDYLVAVPDPAAWHASNLASNPAHYTAWAARHLLGGGGVACLAEAVGAGPHFNTGLAWPEEEGHADARGGAPSPRRTLKYGVIGLAALGRDLLTWDRLYPAGRLHKPAVRVLVGEGGAGGRTNF